MDKYEILKFSRHIYLKSSLFFTLNNSIKEKPQDGRGWINGGFFVLEPEVSDYIKGDETPFELEPMERLSSDGQLMAFKHEGFWHPCDVIRDKQNLDNYWEKNLAPWKKWI